jgi:hypothetical protein
MSSEHKKEWRIKNRDKIKEYNKEYNKTDKKKDYNKKFRKTDKYKIYQREYRLKNRDKIKEYKKEYRKTDKAKTYRKNYQRNKRKTDMWFKFKSRLRSLITHSIKGRGFTKKSKTFQIIGCSFEEARTLMDKKFTDGMTWDNHGEWHIDHIIPMSTAKTEEEAVRLNHISNLQPLWATDNLHKSDKLDWNKS